MATGIDELALNHAMKHFEIHAAQRLTAFNFFIVISGAILAAIATILQKPDKFGWAVTCTPTCSHSEIESFC